MCKHVAAALYGVGARLDERPQLLFVLRGVDESELLADAGQDLARSKPAPTTAKVLDDGDVAALFGLDMAEDGNSNIPAAASSKPSSSTRTSRTGKASARPPAAKHDDPIRRARTGARSKLKGRTGAKKKPARKRTKPPAGR